VEKLTNHCATSEKSGCPPRRSFDPSFDPRTRKHKARSPKFKRRVPVTASNAWPDSIVEMEREVDNQVAAPAETRTPNLHRANETLIKSADGRVATVVARKKALGEQRWIGQDHSAPRSTFHPSGSVAERSSPSRVRCAAQNAPLTAPGRSENCSARRERGTLGKATTKTTSKSQTRLDIDGILMEGVLASVRCLFALFRCQRVQSRFFTNDRRGI
jgi:hypothetical protein